MANSSNSKAAETEVSPQDKEIAALKDRLEALTLLLAQNTVSAAGADSNIQFPSPVEGEVVTATIGTTKVEHLGFKPGG